MKKIMSFLAFAFIALATNAQAADVVCEKEWVKGQVVRKNCLPMDAYRTHDIVCEKELDRSGNVVRKNCLPTDVDHTHEIACEKELDGWGNVVRKNCEVLDWE